ncbi:MAG: AraC family ligand binding domain-containing protein [Burkholderiales bacterium]
MTSITFAAFESDARSAGYDEVLERHWGPNTVVPTHTHPFSVKAIVIAGEMWLTAEGATRHLKPGDTFELNSEVPHDERYGDEGTTFWAARRH